VNRECGSYGTDWKYRKYLAGEFEEKRSPGRPGYRCEDKAKLDLKELAGWSWTGFVWFRKETSCELL
jgi:hypothetical protein